MIKAEIVADSKNEFGNRLTTFEVTFPRIILAEKNTHRMLSRNSASSRAIPFKKMLKSVISDPFIPIAWQKDHKGMQGTEYFSKTETFMLDDFREILKSMFEEKETFDYFNQAFWPYDSQRKTLDEWWLIARDRAVESAVMLACFGVTKQVCNRLLEPFMWCKVLVSATEWENFFHLRCPRYQILIQHNGVTTGQEHYRSKKDYLQESVGLHDSMVDWHKVNKGQAEIHMMALAEAMWDAYNESTPKQLKAGEWHIPYENRIDVVELSKLAWDLGFAEEIANEGFKEFLQDTLDEVDGVNSNLYPGNKINTAWGFKKEKLDELRVKVSTFMAARTSYTVVGDDLKPMSYAKMIENHDKLAVADPVHASPFEHCGQAMGELDKLRVYGDDRDDHYFWSGNFRGFKQYRKMIPNENKI